MTSLLLSLWLHAAPAAELAGATLPDTTTAPDGTPLVLNGLGLRELWWIDIYVGGLYLPSKTTSGATAVQTDAAKRIVMHFIYRKVTPDQMKKVFREGIAIQPNAAELSDQLARLEAMMDRDVLAGEQITIDYLPGKGTTFSFNGKAKGTIEGKAFMLAIWGMFLGDHPVNEKLKAAMLGG
jgi:hypothetical protein